MKIPLDWLKDYIETKKTKKELADSFTAIGLMLDKNTEDEVLDLEHRMDRSDWLSVTGCARDLAAFEDIKFIYPKTHNKKGLEGGNINIEVKCPELVKRFNTRVFRGVKVAESPLWLKERLETYGIPSINNIVDITNFVMVELGQPMHAQDLAKFEKPEIVIRKAKQDEEIVTLDGSNLKLDNNMFVLTQNDKATVIGGVVGGKATSVDFETKDIILDAGNYNQANIRKTARKLKIQNETVLRYDKFLHPEGCQKAIERATYLILQLAGGEFYENIDYYPTPEPLKELSLRYNRIKLLSGMDIEKKEIKRILASLEYVVIEESEDSLKLQIPYFRTDVEIEDDIVSDVLRINDYAKIPSALMQTAPPKNITEPIYKFEEKLKDILVKSGAHEFITDPIVQSTKDENQIILENALSSEKNALRTNIYQTLSPVLESYEKNGLEEVTIFEIGKVYEVNGELEKYTSYSEKRVLEVIVSQNEDSYSTSQNIKKIFWTFIHDLGIENVKIEKSKNSKFLIYADKLEIGEIRFDSFTINTEQLIKAKTQISRVNKEFKNYSKEDITFDLKINENFSPILEELRKLPEIQEIKYVGEFFKNAKEKSVTIQVLYKMENEQTFETVQTALLKIKNQFV